MREIALLPSPSCKEAVPSLRMREHPSPQPGSSSPSAGGWGGGAVSQAPRGSVPSEVASGAC